MNFFFDRCVPVRLARMLDEYDTENQVIYHDAWFPPETSDVEWITKLAREAPKPVVITADQNARRNPIERQAFRSSGLTVVFLARSLSSNIDIHTYAVKMLTIWPQLVFETTRVREPTAFEITSSAKKLTRLSRTADLR